MIFYTTNNNAFVFSHNKIDQSPKQLYQNWCDEYNVLEPNKSNIEFNVKNADDNCYYLQTKHSVKDDCLKLFTLSSEGAIGIASHFAYPENSGSSISIKNINRMYNVLGGTDFQIISFHPENTDDGFGDVFVQLLDDVTLIGGELRRSSVTDFAIKIENNKLTLAIKSNKNTPVYFNDFVNKQNLHQQSLIDTATANDKKTLVIQYSNVVGYLNGKVIGKKGEPAQRQIVVHERTTGKVVGKTMSDTTGNFVVGVSTPKECYAIALDNDEPPFVNSLIFDRVKVRD